MEDQRKEEARKMLLADAIQANIEAEIKISRMRRAICGLSLCLALIGGLLLYSVVR